MSIKHENSNMVRKLAIIAVAMFAFGYALVPLYKAICEMTGINILSLGERNIPGATSNTPANTQIDKSRLITIEFDANSRGPWDFKPAVSSIKVHPGELAKVMYEFQNKLECFCFNQYTLEAGEKKQWPVAFVIDPKLSKDVSTITLSYTFFEVGGKTPAAPVAALGVANKVGG
jgi:cytochrome c oxidase assembly protein subunit 11